MGEWRWTCELLTHGEQHGQSILANSSIAISNDGRRMKNSSIAMSEKCTVPSEKDDEKQVVSKYAVC